MPEAKKTAKAKRHMADVIRPGKAVPAATSRPVIVTNRPLLKDPMTVEADTDRPADAPPPAEPLRAPAEQKIEPPTAAEPASPTPDDPPAINPAESTSATTDPPDNPAAPQPDSDDPNPDPDTKAEAIKDPEASAQLAASKAAEHEIAIQKLVDSRQYFLPVNTVEKRRSKRVVVLGILLSLVLLAAWADIALDAGLIHLGGLKPLTHFFSS